MKTKLKAHLFILPRWFAMPFFGSMVFLGAALAGGINANAWIAFAAVMLVMAGGHSFNSLLDYSWTGLDKGELKDRSAEKGYTGGQSLIAKGIVSEKEVLFNATGWYILALIPIFYLTFTVGWPILVVGVLGMLVTFWYAWGKFNWTHELSLAIGVGPMAVLIGMFAVDPGASIWVGILAGVPMAILLGPLGLALDEWPDAEANLKKGVKSIAYKVWEYKISLPFFVISWAIVMFMFQLFLITIGILNPMSWLSFLILPLIIALSVMLKEDFEKYAKLIVLVGMFYGPLMVVGQAIGS